jgi:trimethylamine--corrinoid protein Co-methyltransferase
MVRRQGSRRQKKPTSGALPSPQPAFSSLQNHMPALTPLSQDQLETIHHASLKLLEEIGMEVTSAEARAFYKAAGAEVDEVSELVKLPSVLVMDLLKTVPSTFTLTPTNPDRALTIGGNHIHFGMVSGAPNVHCALHGRRTGNFADYKNFIKLGQSFNILHFFQSDVSSE